MLSLSLEHPCRAPLRSGGSLQAALQPSGAVLVSRSSFADDTPEARVTLPAMPCGHGGGGLVVAPQEGYALVHGYSGQRESWFDLLELAGGLRHRLHHFGPARSTHYSFDEVQGALVVVRTLVSWGSGEELLDAALSNELLDERALLDDASRFSLDFASLHHVSLGDFRVRDAALRLHLTVGFCKALGEPPEDWDGALDLGLELVSGRLQAQMPWGPMACSLPLEPLAEVWLG